MIRTGNGGPAKSDPLLVEEQVTARLHSRVVDQVVDQPYQALALAFGVGVVLGGGVWRHLARSVLTMTARFAVAAATTAIVDRIHPHTNPSGVSQ